MPILRRRTLLTLPILAAAGIPALVACSDNPRETTGPGGDASPSQQPGTPPPAGWQTLESYTAGHHISVDIAPLVTMDEKTTILPLRITRMADDDATDDINESDGEWDWTHLWKAPALLDNRPIAGTRLIDTAGRRVWNCIDGTVPTEARSLEKGRSGMAYAVFGPVDTDRVTAFLPLTGFPEIAVISKDEAAGILGPEIDLDKALAAIDVASYDSERQDDAPTLAEISAPASIDTFTRALDKSSTSRTTDTSITTTLASDVTFEFGKYNLTAEADGQLQTVAGQLASYPNGGELSIVGHTDDQADEAFNQTLSEQRAAAVRKRLGELTDLSAWSVTEQGKGEKEPAVQGTDDAARATNRRVVITLTPTGGTTTTSTSSASPSATASDDALPEAKGPVGSGAGSALTVPSDDGSVSPSITVESITRRDGLLLGRLTITGNTENTVARAWFEDNSDIGGIFANSRGEDGDSFPFAGLDGVTLLAGGLRYMPCDYIIGGRGYHRPLADTQLHWGITGGTSMAFVIWPDVGQDTLIVDHQEGARSGAEQPWRITDVSVTAS